MNVMKCISSVKTTALKYNRMNKPLHRWILILSMLMPLYPALQIFAGGQPEEQPEGQRRPGIAVSILPMKYFVERISGDDFEVMVIVPPGKSPATYEPTPRQVGSLAGAKILFAIGVPFENAFLPTIASTMKKLRIVDTSEKIEKRSIQNEIDRDGHSDAGGEEHTHDPFMPDPHIWLVPRLVRIQARTILEALIETVPEKSAEYTSNCDAFITELEELDTMLRKTLAPVKGSPILVYHPSFGYFAEEYGLSQIPIELGGNEPTPRQLEQIITLSRNKNIRVIFVQPEFSKTSAARVAQAIDGAVVEVAPLREDYIQNMFDIAESIQAGITR